MDKDYTCTLDEKTLQKAIDELGENPETRLTAVQNLRSWMMEQPDLQHAPIGKD